MHRFSEDEAGSGVVENTHAANADTAAVFGDTLYVSVEECACCTGRLDV